MTEKKTHPLCQKGCGCLWVCGDAIATNWDSGRERCACKRDVGHDGPCDAPLSASPTPPERFQQGGEMVIAPPPPDGIPLIEAYNELVRQLDALKAEKERVEKELFTQRADNAALNRWRARELSERNAAEQSRDEIREAVREWKAAQTSDDILRAARKLRALVPDPEKE